MCQHTLRLLNSGVVMLRLGRSPFLSQWKITRGTRNGFWGGWDKTGGPRRRGACGGGELTHVSF